jgi:hypothetical protein
MQLADLGLMGMMTSADYGGAGMDTISYVLAMEEISKVDSSVSVAMSVNNSLVCWGLEHYANEAQKQQFESQSGRGATEQEMSQIRDQIWEKLVFENVYANEFEIIAHLSLKPLNAAELIKTNAGFTVLEKNINFFTHSNFCRVGNANLALSN